jgi:pimeloyl-ACP methyl ester carboxylesterase
VTDPVQEVIAKHERAGRRFVAGGVESFVREQGSGQPVVLVHGVPSSSFLYRKMLEPLAEGGFRAVAFDFPGLGLAERPQDFDYSWSGLSAWMSEALEALGIERCHLVVHDIGGPIGCEVAVREPERVVSLTALNTFLNLVGFRRPWSMHPFSIPRVGELYLRTMSRFAFKRVMYLQGVKDRAATSDAELYAYLELIKREDEWRAFLKVMSGFELTEEKQRFLWEGLAARPYPAQVVWGASDPALSTKHRLVVQHVLRVERPTLLPAKHFLQEDQAPAVAAAVTSFARSASGDYPPGD